MLCRIGSPLPFHAILNPRQPNNPPPFPCNSISATSSWFLRLPPSTALRWTRPSFVLHCKPSSSDLPPHRKVFKSVHGVCETVVGILGGGQLGKMLCQAASRMGIKVIVLDPMENCPASGLCYTFVKGSFDDSVTVQEFAKRCGVLTVEIEHVNVEALEKLEKEGMDCQPRASTIRIIQDKYLQKLHFSNQDIPVPEFMQICDINSAERVGKTFGYPVVIKSRRLAYDGRGNVVVRCQEDIPTAISDLGGYDRGLYVEKWTPFVKELAVIVARGRCNNSLMCYPVVETIHRENICDTVKAPADIPWKIRKLAVDVACKAVNSLEGVGVFAVELFLTKNDEILLNEVAPRPHNSGHHTIESCFTSQFEQHLRAILGLPLGSPSMKTPAAIMHNLIGDEEGELGFHRAHVLMESALSIPGANVHWYNKTEMWKNRKMGHLTIVGSSMTVVQSLLHAILSKEAINENPKVNVRVGIIMGSDYDLPIMEDASKILKIFGVPHEVRIVSAHRTPEMMFSYASTAAERGIKVIIAGAGGAAHLPGMVAALTSLPVVGVPVRASTLDGLDSLLSIVQMPRGVPVATVGINNATNAGLLAVRMLGVGDSCLFEKMVGYLEEVRDGALAKAENFKNEKS